MLCGARLAGRLSRLCWPLSRRPASRSQEPRSLAYGWLVSRRPGPGPGRPLIRHARGRTISSQYSSGHHRADNRARPRTARCAGIDSADRTERAPPPRREGAGRHPGRAAVSAATAPDRLCRGGRIAGRGATRGLSPLAGLPFAIDGAFELGLRHLRSAGDALLASLVAELIVGPALGAGMRAQAAAALGRNVHDRGSARFLRFTRAGALLVHRPRRDLFRLLFAGPTLLETAFDVLVLTLALWTPGVLRHVTRPP